MKTWKLVSGILSIIFSVFMLFQSCAVGFVNSIKSNDSDISGSVGVMVSFLILAGGIVSISTKGSKGNGGNWALSILFGLAGLIGYSTEGTYGDLAVWAVWAFICAILAVMSMIDNNRTNQKQISNPQE